MKYSYLSFILSSIFIRIFSAEYCKYGVSCLNSCTQCGDDNDFSDCNYVNLFCGNSLFDYVSPPLILKIQKYK